MTDPIAVYSLADNNSNRQAPEHGRGQIDEQRDSPAFGRVEKWRWSNRNKRRLKQILKLGAVVYKATAFLNSEIQNIKSNLTKSIRILIKAYTHIQTYTIRQTRQQKPQDIYQSAIRSSSQSKEETSGSSSAPLTQHKDIQEHTKIYA